MDISSTCTLIKRLFTRNGSSTCMNLFSLCVLIYILGNVVIHATIFRYLSFFFLAMSQSAINPIIVIGMNSRFRGYVTEFFFHCTRRRCCNQNPTPHTVHYVAATPPLLRRYSQSCSHSRSKSRSGGKVTSSVLWFAYVLQDFPNNFHPRFRC